MTETDQHWHSDYTAYHPECFLCVRAERDRLREALETAADTLRYFAADTTSEGLPYASFVSAESKRTLEAMRRKIAALEVDG